jgi:glycosyltransferase involved in cell wall biosynthesis
MRGASIGGDRLLRADGEAIGPVRILMFCGYFRPVIGGAERQAELLARALLRKGLDVEVLTPRRDPSWPEHEIADGLPIRRFALTDLCLQYRGVPGLGIPNLLIERSQVRRALAEFLPGFDLLHTHLASPIVAFALDSAHSLGVPVLCKIACGGETFDFKSVRAASVLGGYLTRKLVSRMDLWAAISDEVRLDLLSAGVSEEAIVAVPNGIDAAALPPFAYRKPARRFLCLGRIEKFDFSTLLRGFETVLEAIPDAELRIAGRGSTAGIMQLLKGLPRARSRTTLVGFSPSVEQLLWADAVVHPSIAEGMSNTLMEALCLGVPCAASDIPPNVEMLGTAGLLAPLGDSAAFATAMRRLGSDNDLGRSLADAGRRRIDQHYGIDIVATRYQRIYEDLVRTSDSRARSR